MKRERKWRKEAGREGWNEGEARKAKREEQTNEWQDHPLWFMTQKHFTIKTLPHFFANASGTDKPTVKWTDTLPYGRTNGYASDENKHNYTQVAPSRATVSLGAPFKDNKQADLTFSMLSSHKSLLLYIYFWVKLKPLMSGITIKRITLFKKGLTQQRE